VIPDWRTKHCAEPAIAAAAAARGLNAEDLWATLGGCPRSWREAAALYRRLGVRSLAEAVSAVLGPPFASPRLARRGDVVMAQGALGLCRGGLAEFLGREGATMLPMRAAEIAWPVAAEG